MTQSQSATIPSSPPFAAPIPSDTRPSQRLHFTQLVCALGIIVPMAVIALWVHHLQDGSMTLTTMLLGPLLGGGTLIFWILFLHLVVCGDGLDSLGFRLGRPWLDVLLGLVLGAGMLAFHSGFHATAGELFPPRPPVPEIVDLLVGLARDPWLLALWLGPVVWIGVALFEELARAFLLRRLWLVWRGPAGRWAVILLVSTFLGLAHAYQGSAAAFFIGVKSVLLGWFYLRTGRIRALVVCHGAYDSVQIILAVIMIRQIEP